MCLPLPVDNELQDLRSHIDGLDCSIDEMILRRIRLGRLACKMRGGAATDPFREAVILARTVERADSPRSAYHLMTLRRFLFDWSKEAIHE